MNKSPIVIRVFLLLFILILSSSFSFAKDNNVDIQTESFWVALPPAVAKNTAGYGVIKNTGNEVDTLIGIHCDAATVMLHKTEIKSGVARMIHIPKIIIEPHSKLVLEPMSYHLMFSKLSKRFFTEGNKISLQLEFEKSGITEVKLPVRTAWQ